MRGVIAGGMATALEELRLRDVFDFVVGSSAGALAGAYFLAGQAGMGTRMYFEDLIGRRWLAYRRMLKGSPILGFDYLFDELIAKRKPLDCRSVRRSGIELYAVATRVPEYQPTVLGKFESDSELLAALRASACVPLIAGRSEPLNGAEYVDGSLTDGIPVASAETLGATHMLVLLTRPRGQTRSDPNGLQRRVGFPLINRVQEGLGDACLQRAPLYREALRRLEQRQSAGGQGPTAFAVQLGAGTQKIGILSQNRAVLEEGARAGAEAVRQTFGGAGIEAVAEPVD